MAQRDNGFQIQLQIQKKLGTKILGVKKSWGQKMLGQKMLGQKSWGQKKLGSKICEVNKGLLGSTKVCNQTNFGTKKSGVVCNARGVCELWESEDPPWHMRYTTMQN